MKIKILLAFFPFLFFTCRNENVSKNTIQEMENILDQSIKSSAENYFYMEGVVHKKLIEPGMKKYRFLGGVIQKQQEEYTNFIKKLDQHLTEVKINTLDIEKKKKTLNHYQNLLTKVDSSMLNLFQNVISQNQKALGLRKESVISYGDDSRKKLNQLSNSIDPKVSADIVEDSIFLLKLKMFHFGVGERIILFSQLYQDFIGGWTCGFTVPFPIVYPKKSQIKEGEYFEAEVFIGERFYDYYEETFGAIIINKTDTINIDKNTGKAILKIRANRKGEFELDIGARVSNELTGEISGGNIIFNYHVD